MNSKDVKIVDLVLMEASPFGEARIVWNHGSE